MWMIRSALRRPLTVMVLIVAIALGAFLAVGNSVCEQLGIPYPEGLPQGHGSRHLPEPQPAGDLRLPALRRHGPGADGRVSHQLLRVPLPLHQRHPSRRVAERAGHGPDEALLSSRAPNMAQAMAETINYVNRSRAFMPPGTVSPFVMRFDTGSVPVGYLVLSSETRSDRRDSGPGAVPRAADVRQPCRAFRRRRRSAAARGRSSSRSIPQRLQSYGMSPDEVVTALTQRQHDQPVGQRAGRRQVSRSCR